jgi:hypothetical protein
MSSSNTQTGDILERMILPALRRGQYTWERHAYIGERPSGASHYVDALVTTANVRLILVASKWQQVSGTAEQKVPFELICLVHALKSGKYEKAYLVLGGPGWTLRDFYINGGLEPYLRHDKVEIISLESFVAKANKGEL